jgi:hypothetical protein
MYIVPERGVLATRAEYVVEAAGWFPGRPDELAVALGYEPDLAGHLPDWLVNLVADLGRAGLGAEAVRVGDALARVDPESRAFYDGSVAVALAAAGLAEQAKARIDANLTRWPDDLWIRIHAGDALLALGDLEGAKAHSETAVGIAEGCRRCGRPIRRGSPAQADQPSHLTGRPSERSTPPTQTQAQ